MKIFLAKFETQFGATRFMTFNAESKELAADHGKTVANSFNIGLRLVSVKTVPSKRVDQTSMGILSTTKEELMLLTY